MKDFQFMYQSLIKEIAKFENLKAANAMSSLGLKYPVNYGLSVNQLNNIAGIIDRDDHYAKYLWKQNEREAKLIALRIFETQEFEMNNLNEFVVGISNVELAEQAAMLLFSKQKNVVEVALHLIRLNSFAQLSGCLSISRFAMLNKNAESSIFEKLLDELRNNLPSDNAVYIRRGFAQALLKIGLINTELANTVKKIIISIAESDSNFGSYLQQEVVAFFY